MFSIFEGIFEESTSISIRWFCVFGLTILNKSDGASTLVPALSMRSVLCSKSCFEEISVPRYLKNEMKSNHLTYYVLLFA